MKPTTNSSHRSHPMPALEEKSKVLNAVWNVKRMGWWGSNKFQGEGQELSGKGTFPKYHKMEIFKGGD